MWVVPGLEPGTSDGLFLPPCILEDEVVVRMKFSEAPMRALRAAPTASALRTQELTTTFEMLGNPVPAPSAPPLGGNPGTPPRVLSSPVPAPSTLPLGGNPVTPPRVYLDEDQNLSGAQRRRRAVANALFLERRRTGNTAGRSGGRQVVLEVRIGALSDTFPGKRALCGREGRAACTGRGGRTAGEEGAGSTGRQPARAGQVAELGTGRRSHPGPGSAPGQKIVAASQVPTSGRGPLAADERRPAAGDAPLGTSRPMQRWWTCYPLPANPKLSRPTMPTHAAQRRYLRQQALQPQQNATIGGLKRLAGFEDPLSWPNRPSNTAREVARQGVQRSVSSREFPSNSCKQPQAALRSLLRASPGAYRSDLPEGILISFERGTTSLPSDGKVVSIRSAVSNTTAAWFDDFRSCMMHSADHLAAFLDEDEMPGMYGDPLLDDDYICASFVCGLCRAGVIDFTVRPKAQVGVLFVANSAKKVAMPNVLVWWSKVAVSTDSFAPLPGRFHLGGSCRPLG